MDVKQMIASAQELIQLVTGSNTHPDHPDHLFKVKEVAVSDLSLTYVLEHSHAWAGPYHQGWYPGNRYVTLQFILRSHCCKREVLQGFDLQLCMFGLRMSPDDDTPTPRIFTIASVRISQSTTYTII